MMTRRSFVSGLFPCMDPRAWPRGARSLVFSCQEYHVSIREYVSLAENIPSYQHAFSMHPPFSLRVRSVSTKYRPSRLVINRSAV